MTTSTNVLGYSVNTVDSVASVESAQAAFDADTNNDAQKINLQIALNAAYANAYASEKSLLPVAGAAFASSAIAADIADMKANGVTQSNAAALAGNLVTMVGQGVSMAASPELRQIQ